MTEYTTVVLFVKALVAPVGVGLTYLAYRAYRQTGDIALRSFAVGFGAITLGAILGGGLDQILGVSIGIGLLFHSLFTAVGFVVLARSAYMEDTHSDESERTLVTVNE